MFRDVGDRAGMSRALLGLSRLAAEGADPQTAASLQREGLALAREAAFPWGEAQAGAHLAETAVAMGDRDEARAHLIHAIDRALDVHVVPLILRTLLPAHTLIAPEMSLSLMRFIRDHPGSEHEVREAAGRFAVDAERAGVVPASVAPPDEAGDDAWRVVEVVRRVLQHLQAEGDGRKP